MGGGIQGLKNDTVEVHCYQASLISVVLFFFFSLPQSQSHNVIIFCFCLQRAPLFRLSIHCPPKQCAVGSQYKTTAKFSQEQN